MYHDIQVTYSMLSSPKDKLSQEELEAVDDYKELVQYRADSMSKTEETLVSDCRILCSGGERHPVPDYGWMQPVAELCYRLEELNHMYAKYGLKVVLDQAKEKFGTLRFYTHIDSSEIGLVGLLNRPFKTLLNLLDKVDYGMKFVTDKPSYKTVEWRETDKERFDSIKDGHEDFMKAKIASKKEDAIDDGNVYLLEENGKFYRSYILHHTVSGHYEHSRHGMLYAIRGTISKISGWISGFYKEPLLQRVMAHVLDYKTDELIRHAEHGCEAVCQHCGAQFDEKYCKPCETQGWITYVCERCASAAGVRYVKDENVFVEGKPVDDKNPDESKTVENGERK